MARQRASSLSKQAVPLNHETRFVLSHSYPERQIQEHFTELIASSILFTENEDFV